MVGNKIKKTLIISLLMLILSGVWFTYLKPLVASTFYLAIDPFILIAPTFLFLTIMEFVSLDETETT